MTVHYADLAALSAALTAAGIPHALGGSGLLRFLGAEVDVHDWDVTTDAPESAVLPVVRNYPHERLGRSGPFVSKFAFALTVGSSEIDLIGGFAVRDGDETVTCRTIVTGYHESIPLGSPSEWAKIYRALGEHEKASRLDALRR